MRPLSFSCLFLLGTLAAQAQSVTPESAPTITQAGEGIATAAPDEGYVVGGVVTIAPTASAALAENAEAASRIVAAVKARGVAEDKIGTVEFSIEDHYKRVRSADSNNTDQVRDGYAVTNKIKVTVTDLAKFGGTIDAMVTAGANAIDGIHLGNSRTDQIRDKARSEAVADATRRAALIAAGLGYALGEVVSAREGSEVPRYGAGVGSASMAGLSTSTPVVGGSRDYRVNVTVTWKLTHRPLNTNK